jgi:hypothetical protein
MTTTTNLIELADAYALRMDLSEESVATQEDAGYVVPTIEQTRNALIEALEAQAKQIEALQADAERYRYWRNRYPETFAPTDLKPEDIDRITDAARKGNV